jgi:hypothetical protein
MRTLSLLLVSALALAAAPASDDLTVSVPACEKDRRWVLVEYDAKGKALPGSDVADEKGNVHPGQVTPTGLAWLVPFIPAGQKPKFTIKHLHEGVPAPALRWTETGPGVASLKFGDKEITRYHTGPDAEKQKHHKPFFWPLIAQGVNILRGWPVEPRPGDAADHPHHTGMYFAFGEVNGKEYWSKLPIESKSFEKAAGPVFASIRARNAWGDDLDESDDVRFMTDGNDDVVDWTVTLTAANGPATFAKDLKQAKEGAFACRLAKELSMAKGDAPDIILDAKGNRGEAAARKGGAPWVDYSGTIDGKKVGISIMNHPSSFRYPSDWHVRAYGLFAANPWIIKGENTLQKGESITLKWRVYVHGGDAEAAKVADVFAGYADAQAVAE